MIDALLEMKKYLIQSHPTFMCPVTKEILDMHDSEIVHYDLNGTIKTDIISNNGIRILKTKSTWASLKMRIVTNFEDV